MRKNLNAIWVFFSALVGCNAGSNTSISNIQNLQQKQKIQKTFTSKHQIFAPQDLPYTMGGTYDTTTGYPTSTTSCLNAGVAGTYIIANPMAKITFQETQDLNEVLNALGINTAVTIGWGPFSVTTTYNYAHSSQDDAYTLNFNYIYKYAGTAIFPEGTLMQGESALTSAANKVIGLPEQFREMCGDRYIGQMDAGSSVLMNIKLHFNSEVDKDYFDSNLKQVHGLSNVITNILNNPSTVNYTLTASGLQVGGNPQLLNTIFESAGGTLNPSTGYTSVNCGNNESNSHCISLINNVISYVSTISSQLSSPSDYYLSNPVTAKWSTIGIQPGDVYPSQNTLAALQNITTLYNQDQKDFNFINNYSIMLNNDNFLSPNINQNLMNLYGLYQQLLSIYTEPSLNIMNCYEGYVSDKCITINNSLIIQRNQIISQNQQLFDYLKYLENNQYEIRLLIGNVGSAYAYCGLYPITSSIRSLFLVDCNGQVSGSTDTNTGLQIVNNDNNTLTINNLTYSYINNGVTNSFTYSFPNQFVLSPGYTNNFYTFANASMNGTNILSNHKLSVYRVPFN